MQRNIIELPNLGSIYRGFVKVTARNVLTDEVITLFDDHNTLLKPWFDGGNYAIFTSTESTGGIQLIGICDTSSDEASKTWGSTDAVMKTVILGTDNTVASRSDTGLKGKQLASSSSGTTSDKSTFGQSPVYIKRKWVFAAGVGTGTVGEVVLSNGRLFVARQALETLFDKTALHELTVEWTLELSAGSWSGVIPKGQRDGVTDIVWNLTINNRQAWKLAAGCRVNITNYNGPYAAGCLKWDKSFIHVKTGDSNAASDLANDTCSAIKGNELFNGVPALSSVGAYTDGTYYRDINIKFDVGESNGPIGELLYAVDMPIGYQNFNKNDNHIFRCTFTPALDKTNAFQLLLTFRISM